jgi:signal transduction histidine kinase
VQKLNETRSERFAPCAREQGVRIAKHRHSNSEFAGVVVKIAVIIFVVESLVMLSLAFIHVPSTGAEVLLDASVLTVLSSVLIYCTIVNPLTKKLRKTQRLLADAARAAGKAEIATDVLHNVGNVLNSINVSAGAIQETVRASEVTSLNKAVDIIEQHLGDLGVFLTQDDRGKHFPRYLIEVSRQMAEHEERVLEQVNSLISNVDHIKEIVAAQQVYVGSDSTVVEEVSVIEVLEDAIHINAALMQRDSVRIIRQFDEIAPVMLDREKLLHVVVNLIRNAKHACDDSGHGTNQVTVSLRRSSEDSLSIEVRDTGIGIAAENLTRVFSQGFTTLKAGRGFDLHSAALATKELNGCLTARSDGPGTGATFSLNIPYEHAGA